MKKIILVAMPSILFAFLGGCASAPLRVYEGPERSTEQVAKISTEEKKWNRLLDRRPPRLEIIFVDGKEVGDIWVKGYPFEILVAPGHHELQVRMLGTSPVGGLIGATALVVADKVVKKDTLEVEAEAGKHYIIRSAFIKKTDTIPDHYAHWVEEGDTGKVVFGHIPESHSSTEVPK